MGLSVVPQPWLHCSRGALRCRRQGLTGIKGRPPGAGHTGAKTLHFESTAMAYQRILVPVDGSPTSLRGLEEAIRLARSTGGRLRLLHVVDELTFATGFETGAAFAGDVMPLMREAGQAILQQACARAEVAGVPAEPVLCDRFATRVCDAVADEAGRWQADLIVLGTHGRRGVGRLLLGSDAEQVLRLAPVPVLLVRAPASA